MTQSPGLFRRAWHGWKRFGRRLGDIQARVLLTTFYFTIVAPFALAIRVFGDPLALKPSAPKGWRIVRPSTEEAAVRARRQF